VAADQVERRHERLRRIETLRGPLGRRRRACGQDAVRLGEDENGEGRPGLKIEEIRLTSR
jgi:hypothetical protein